MPQTFCLIVSESEKLEERFEATFEAQTFYWSQHKSVGACNQQLVEETKKFYGVQKMRAKLSLFFFGNTPADREQRVVIFDGRFFTQRPETSLEVVRRIDRALRGVPSIVVALLQDAESADSQVLRDQLYEAGVQIVASATCDNQVLKRNISGIWRALETRLTTARILQTVLLSTVLTTFLSTMLGVVVADAWAKIKYDWANREQHLWWTSRIEEIATGDNSSTFRLILTKPVDASEGQFLIAASGFDVAPTNLPRQIAWNDFAGRLDFEFTVNWPADTSVQPQIEVTGPDGRTSAESLPQSRP